MDMIRQKKKVMECRNVSLSTGWILGMVLLPVILSACSVKRTAVNMVGNTLSGGGDVYASDNDPELIREAIPFGLKTFESLLAISPDNEGLLLSAASGFSSYAYMLQDEADRLDQTDLSRARALRERARKLYLRGRDYALRWLELEHPNFIESLKKDPISTLAKITEEDVPFLYWAGVSWAGALSAAKDDVTLIGDLPLAGALVYRVLEIDDTYNDGAAHEFLISYEGSRPGGNVRLARKHYERALEISGGRRASVYLALAQSVVIREQNVEEFSELIEAALAVNPDKVPELRLVNTMARRRAQWLKKTIPNFFLEAEQKEVTK
jgi:predicted anti-sigma-YlaC factor YlaD